MSVKEERESMVIDALKDAELHNSTPPSNVYQLAREVITSFNNNGHGESLRESKSTWWPTEGWFIRHLKAMCKYMRDKENLHFIYFRKKGELRGMWKFTQKKEYRSSLLRFGKGLSTQIDTYNDMLNTNKWKLDLPPAEDMPLLPSE